MIVNIQGFMEYYKVSRPTVYRWLDKGLPAIRINRVVRFDTDLVDKWLKEQTNNN